MFPAKYVSNNRHFGLSRYISFPGLIRRAQNFDTNVHISSMTVDIAWRSIPLSSGELSLARVLRCGQTFRWKNVNSVWSFSTQDRIILLKQDSEVLHYACKMAEDKEIHGEFTLNFIRDYFNLDVKLEPLYKSWALVESKFKPGNALFASFPGIRMLRQDPWETVVLFICSSNNNVKRILKMCDSLCQEYGTYINDYEGVPFYSFPLARLLAQPDVEQRLRELGFGYRARYIYQTACLFMEEETPNITLEALENLRLLSYEEAHAFLLQLTGVGPKVADCICLMALDKHDVVPVDTHVLQIALRDYKYRGPKTMNKSSYHLVRQHLRGLFGEYAGWAQLVMFAADLSDLNNGVNQVGGETIKHEVETIKHEVENIKHEAVESIEHTGTLNVEVEEMTEKVNKRKTTSHTVKRVKKVKA